MNVVQLLEEKIKQFPNKKAVVFPETQDSWGRYGYTHLTFAQLSENINGFAEGFLNKGIKKGDRVLLFIKPCLELSTITFALFKIGAIPVLIDPGMGKDNLLRAIKEVAPDVLIAEPIVHWIRKIYNNVFKSVRINITTATWTMPWSNLLTLHDIKENHPGKLEEVQVSDDDLAAILFTSGGTGKPKGVEYTHKIFYSQTLTLQKTFDLNPLDIDLPGFLLFSMCSIALGMTSCIPDMDPIKPSKADPRKLLQTIQDFGVTFVAGSPAIWENLGHYCRHFDLTLPTIKYLFMFGAPVRTEIHELFKDILVNGTTYTPYGATEGLPVACISGKELFDNGMIKKHRQGKGTCVGKPVDGCKIKIIPISFEQQTHLVDHDQGKWGEVVVQGDMITKSYYNRDDANSISKIVDEDKIWHRMGDLGYFDEEGYLWFGGRKAHLVTGENKQWIPIPCEAIFNQHPLVKKSALVKIQKEGQIEPAIVIEPVESHKSINEKKLFTDLGELALKNEHTKDIKQFFINYEFPVDVRHNIKIDRKNLSQWVQHTQVEK